MSESNKGGIKIVTTNRKAFAEYFILEKYDSGLSLLGSEIKSIRDGNVQMRDSYIFFHNNELFWIGGYIGEYKQSSYNNHAIDRQRKLLLKRKEIDHLIESIKEKGLTIVPLKLYLKDGIAKLEIGLAKGKKSYDKRETIKTRDVQRDLERARRR